MIHSILKKILFLEQKLTENPDDIQGWALLSRTYLALGQYTKASLGLKKVIELGGANADIYASLADATALAADGNMQGEPTRYADQALSLNPNNRQALWLRGLAAVQMGEKELAKNHWGKLLVILEDQPAQQNELKAIMADALGSDTLPQTQATESPSSVAQTPAETVTPVEGGLIVNVDIADSIKSSANPQDIVFVFARAVNGPPPPVAVKRLRVADLPTTISLSDNDAMVPQFKMSLYPEITVSARLSKSGQPVAQPGDFESAKISAAPGQSETLSLLIQTEVE